MSSDSEGGSDIEECGSMSNIAETVMKREIIAMDISIPTLSAETMSVATLNQLDANSQSFHSNTPNDNDSTEAVSETIFRPSECTSITDNSAAVANDSTENSATAAPTGDSSDEDTIDLLVKGTRSSLQKSTERDHNNDDREAVESRKFDRGTDKGEDSVMKEADEDRAQPTKYSAVDSPCKTLVYSSELDESATATSKYNDLNGDNSVHSEDSFGLVVDENHDEKPTDSDDCPCVQRDSESRKEGQEDDDDKESSYCFGCSDCSVVMIKEDNDANKLAFSVDSVNDDQSAEMDGVENSKAANYVELRFLECDVMTSLDRVIHRAEKQSFFEKRSKSDDELVKKGTYGLRVENEVNDSLAASQRFGYEASSRIELLEEEMAKATVSEVSLSGDCLC